ncbi:MAG: hypothetical protein A2X49_01700 [Lentisphaerae bacterium GWF2_52_8]|nr:MAG: hypothetical protein A2X49_01700 [Lentisphaerae bacterium GWF2_52_8]
MTEMPEIPGLPVITRMQFLVYDPIWAHETHKNDSHELLYVVKGNVRLSTEKDCHKAGSGEVLFNPARQSHRDEFDMKEELDIFLVFFKWPALDTVLQGLGNDIFRTLQDQSKNRIRRILGEMRAAATLQKAASPLDTLVDRSLLASVLFSLLKGEEPQQIDAGENSKSERQGPRAMLFQRAKNYIERQYAEDLSLSQIATALGVSPYHLSRVFSSQNNFSLFKHLSQVRMLKATELLLERRMNIAEVAAAVGFKDPAYFSKAFKKHHGKSPSDFIA